MNLEDLLRALREGRVVHVSEIWDINDALRVVRETNARLDGDPYISAVQRASRSLAVEFDEHMDMGNPGEVGEALLLLASCLGPLMEDGATGVDLCNILANLGALLYTGRG